MSESVVESVEHYLATLQKLRSTGGTTGETSYYSVLEGLLCPPSAFVRQSGMNC